LGDIAVCYILRNTTSARCKTKSRQGDGVVQQAVAQGSDAAQELLKNLLLNEQQGKIK